ncbi:MAG: LapA family protein [Planctomycetota bacterium]
MLQKIRWFVILSGLLVVVVVAFQNQEPVDLNLLFFRGEYPLTLLLLATSAISFVVGSLMTALRIRSRAKTAELKAKAARSDKSRLPSSTGHETNSAESSPSATSPMDNTTSELANQEAT